MSIKIAKKAQKKHQYLELVHILLSSLEFNLQNSKNLIKITL